MEKWRVEAAKGGADKLKGRPNVGANSNNRNQFSSFILFLSVIILVNLCPFQPEFGAQNFGEQKFCPDETKVGPMGSVGSSAQRSTLQGYLAHLEDGLHFVRLIFTNPMRLSKRATRSTLAEAKVLGKMAKMWYIKKKIKKLSKKLKKHTIAVPVFTAIPIYEHSYYPQPHVTHVNHGGMHHAAASSYSPAVAQIAAAATAAAPAIQSQQLATSASNTNHQMAAYRAPAGHHHHHHSLYHPMQAASAHQIINSYAPSPPLYVDEAGGLYGHYGNAYGRYDGGYQLW